MFAMVGGLPLGLQRRSGSHVAIYDRLCRCAVKANRENLDHLWLPEIKDFNAIGYTRRFKAFTMRCRHGQATVYPKRVCVSVFPPKAGNREPHEPILFFDLREHAAPARLLKAPDVGSVQPSGVMYSANGAFPTSTRIRPARSGPGQVR